MSVVDDYGRFHAHPTLLKAACFPLKLDEVAEDGIVAWLNECQACGLVTLYAINGKKFLELIDFRNRKRALHSKYPANPATDTSPSDCRGSILLPDLLTNTVGRFSKTPADAVRTVGDFCEIPTRRLSPTSGPPSPTGRRVEGEGSAQPATNPGTMTDNCPANDCQPPVTSATRSENRETMIESVIHNDSFSPTPPLASSRAYTSPNPSNAPPGEGPSLTSSLDSHAALRESPPPLAPSGNRSQSAQSVDPSPPKRRPYPADNEFIAALKANPAYAQIDIDREIHKARAWLLTPAGRGRQLTRKFIVNWLNRTDTPLLPEKISPEKSPEQIEKKKNETARAAFIHQLAARIKDGLSLALVTEARALNPAEFRMLNALLPVDQKNELRILSQRSMD